MASFEGLDYITPLTINSRERVSRSETLNLKTQAVSNGSQRWDMTITLAPSNNKESNPGGARLGIHRAQHGLHTSFEMEMPQYIGATFSSANQEVEVGTQGYPAGTSTLDVHRGRDGIPDITIRAGRFIRFDSHPKIYQLIDEVTTNGIVSVSANIYPPLVHAVAVDERIHLTPNATVYYAADGTEGVTYTDGILTRSTMSVVEAL